MAEIVSIMYKPTGVTGKPLPFVRVPSESVELRAKYGMVSDCRAGHPKRQLNIMSVETMDALKREGFLTAPGELGEQLIISGLVVETLVPGDRIRLGETACAEVIELREPCERFEAAQNKPKEQAVNRIGVIARVIESGTIRIGDSVAFERQAVEAGQSQSVAVES